MLVNKLLLLLPTQNCTAGNTLILAAADDYGDGVGQQIVSISDEIILGIDILETQLQILILRFGMPII